MDKNLKLNQIIQVAKNDLLNNDALIQDILTKVCIQTIHKQQQKVNVNLQDSIADLLNNFKKSIEQKIFDLNQKWTLSSGMEPFLFPRNCRFVYSKGKNVVVVIEQEPCIRTLRFDKQLLDNTIGRNNQTVNKQLLVPYCLFILHFEKEKFCGLYTVWRKSAICDLKDIVYNPILPNIHKNYNVCRGKDKIVGNNLSQSCEFVVSNFWNSIFNVDLRHFWDQMSKTGIKNVDDWEQRSSNPFLYNDVELQGTSTLKKIIDQCFINDVSLDAVELRKQLSEDIDLCTKKMFDKLTSYVKSNKFEKFYPNDIRKELSNSLDSIFNEIEILLNKMSDAVPVQSSTYRWEKGGPAWQERT